MRAAYRSLEPCCLLSPLPVVMVSVGASGRKPNIFTAAWCGTVNSQPPMISVSIRKERYSHAFVTESREFVVNLAAKEQCRDLDFCGVKSGREIDKFQHLHLEPLSMPHMDWAPGISGVPASLGCKVRHTLPLGSHDLFIGEVVDVQVREDLFDSEDALHLERAGLVCYTHGLYQQVSDILGFFGYSVAKPDVLRKRMERYRGQQR